MLSASRLVFLPLLYVFALSRMDLAFVIAYALLGSTDYFDGLAARLLNQHSAFGKALDSFTDLPFFLSTAFFMAWLHMEYLKPNMLLLYVFFGLLGLSLVVSAIRCGKPVLIHTIVAKAGAVLVYIAMVLASFLDATVVVAVALAVNSLAFFEEILIFLIYGDIDPDTTTIFRIRLKPKES